MEFDKALEIWGVLGLPRQYTQLSLSDSVPYDHHLKLKFTILKLTFEIPLFKPIPNAIDCFKW